MKTLNAIIPVLAIVLFLGTACEQEGPAERAGKKIDEAVEETGDKLEEAAEKTQEQLKETKENLKEKYNESELLNESK